MSIKGPGSRSFRRIAGTIACALAAALIAVPARALAASPLGSLSQLTSPNNCIGSAPECGTTSTASLAGSSAIVVSPDGKNVYMLVNESVAEFSRHADGSLGSCQPQRLHRDRDQHPVARARPASTSRRRSRSARMAKTSTSRVPTQTRSAQSPSSRGMPMARSRNWRRLMTASARPDPSEQRCQHAAPLLAVGSPTQSLSRSALTARTSTSPTAAAGRSLNSLVVPVGR